MLGGSLGWQQANPTKTRWIAFTSHTNFSRGGLFNPPQMFEFWHDVKYKQRHDKKLQRSEYPVALWGREIMLQYLCDYL